MTKKKKKRMKLPNGFGSIKYLGERRRNPYAVYPPVEKWTEKGPVTPKALGYKSTWEEAYELLTTFNLEKQGKIKTHGSVYIDRTPTFKEVYEKWYNEKYHGVKEYSKQSEKSTRAAFKNLSELHDRQIGQLRYDDLQDVINNSVLGYSSISNMVSVLKQMYRYALKREIIDKDYSAYLYMPKGNDAEHGVPFTDADLQKLWKHKTDPIAEMLLIMCYSGYRISAYLTLYVNTTDWYFKGGVKTASSKDRIVPIHTCIRELVTNRMQRVQDSGRGLLGVPDEGFRQEMYAYLKELGIEKHTPHDCRHTFSALCERYGVAENDRKRLLGHSFGGDITNGVYGHRTVGELREQIQKIQLPDGVAAS